jgi:hypothetical protein
MVLKSPSKRLAIGLSAAGLRGCDRIRLTDDLRSLIIADVAKCLVDASQLALYTLFLQTLPNKQARTGGTLQEGQLREVRRYGLSVLKGDDLIRLALDPAALWSLFERLVYDKDLGDYWADLMAETEVSKLAKKGLRVADVFPRLLATFRAEVGKAGSELSLSGIGTDEGPHVRGSD